MASKNKDSNRLKTRASQASLYENQTHSIIGNIVLPESSTVTDMIIKDLLECLDFRILKKQIE